MGDRGVAASQPLALPGVSVSASGAATPTLVHEGGSERGVSTGHDTRRGCPRGRRGLVGRGVKEDEGRGGMGEVSYTSRKRRRARARALPDAAVAKPGGADTTPTIIKLIKNNF